MNRLQSILIFTLLLVFTVSMAYAATDENTRIAEKMLRDETVTHAEKAAAYSTYLQIRQNRRHIEPPSTMRAGSDGSAYYFKDQAEPGGPTFSWIDHTVEDSTITFADMDDGNAGPIGVQFPFQLYGNDFTQLYLGVNGYITTSSFYSSFSFAGFPISGPDGLYFWADDMYLDAQSTVTIARLNAPSRFVITYDSLSSWAGPSRLSCQIVLNADGSILFQYRHINGAPGTPTVGIQNVAGVKFLNYSTPSPDNNTAILFTPIPLPVEMTSFSAISADGKVTLRWRTETETNNAHFNLYRSVTSNINGEVIAQVTGHGSTPLPNDYSYIDNRVQNDTTYYYRIADVSSDGIERVQRFVVQAMPSAHATGLVPDKYALTQNFPNPFNPVTQFSFALPEAGTARLVVTNNLGQQVAILTDGFHTANVYRFSFDASHLPSGVYYYTLTTSDYAATKRMTLLK